MTIISILIAFTLCHFVSDLRHLRRFEWLTYFTEHCNGKLKEVPGWNGIVGFLFLLGIPLLVAFILDSILLTTLGQFGAFLFAIAVLIYTFGPRDLDIDVRKVIQADDEDDQKEALETLFGGPVPTKEGECQSAAIDAVFTNALKRWFGIIFWFAVLGVYGALLYRLASWLTEGEYGLFDEQKELFTRLSRLMEWPAAQIFTG